MAADKGKKMKVGEKGEDDNNQIDEALVLSIEKLQEIQDDLEKINEEASDKVLEVEQKYNEIRKPVYDKRNEIIKTIPDFWLTAFLSHPVLHTLLNEEDQKNFQPNPYFEDTKLTKTFTFLDEGTTEITATPIKWKQGMGIPNGVAHEKKGNKGHLLMKGAREGIGWSNCLELSFFGWFSNTVHKEAMEDYQDEDPDDEFEGDEADEG
ncbi:hypothetical protein GH714_021842 [Hevea brasiliensis]|uniref:NAP1-related protein 2 n=1 Tax=Hevea brasiliensis TaxID=3981 RepID=A0A6A6MC99_HEVBR|nr:hypothetical protein GH714_021842 [Hevea brasiliensis]